jgi:hypothetical protein
MKATSTMGVSIPRRSRKCSHEKGLRLSSRARFAEKTTEITSLKCLGYENDWE